MEEEKHEEKLEAHWVRIFGFIGIGLCAGVCGTGRIQDSE
jgi:hypothetical protein